MKHRNTIAAVSWAVSLPLAGCICLPYAKQALDQHFAPILARYVLSPLYLLLCFALYLLFGMYMALLVFRFLRCACCKIWIFCVCTAASYAVIIGGLLVFYPAVLMSPTCLMANGLLGGCVLTLCILRAIDQKAKDAPPSGKN